MARSYEFVQQDTNVEPSEYVFQGSAHGRGITKVVTDPKDKLYGGNRVQAVIVGQTEVNLQNQDELGVLLKAVLVPNARAVSQAIHKAGKGKIPEHVEL